MKDYILKLVDGTDDQYKVYTDNRGTMLCGDQMDEKFIKLHAVLYAIEKCEGDLDLLKFMLPNDNLLTPTIPPAKGTA